MAELQVGIDASRAEKGAKEFSRSASSIRRHAREITGATGKATKAARGFGRAVGNAAKSLASWQTAASAVATGASLGYLIDRTFEASQQLERISRAADVSVERIQELDYVAKQAGMSQDVMRDAIGELSQRMGEAAGDFRRTGGEVTEMGEGFQAAGIKISKIGKMDPSKVFRQVARSIREANSATAALDIAVKSFGDEAGRSMVAALRDMDRGIADTVAEARKLGLVLSEDVVRANAEAARSLDTLYSVISGSLARAISELAPDIKDFVDDITDNPGKIKEFANQVGDIAKAGFRAAEAIANLTNTTSTFFEAIGIAGDPRDQLEARLKALITQRNSLLDTKQGKGGFMDWTRTFAHNFFQHAGGAPFGAGPASANAGGRNSALNDVNRQIIEVKRQIDALDEKAQRENEAVSSPPSKGEESRPGMSAREVLGAMPSLFSSDFGMPSAEDLVPLWRDRKTEENRADIDRVVESLDDYRLTESEQIDRRFDRILEVFEENARVISRQLGMEEGQARELIGDYRAEEKMSAMNTPTDYGRLSGLGFAPSLFEELQSVSNAFDGDDFQHSTDAVLEAQRLHAEATRENARKIRQSTIETNQALYGTNKFVGDVSLSEAISGGVEVSDFKEAVKEGFNEALNLEDTPLSKLFESVADNLGTWTEGKSAKEVLKESFGVLFKLPLNVLDLATGGIIPWGDKKEDRMPQQAQSMSDGAGQFIFGTFLNTLNPMGIGDQSAAAKAAENESEISKWRDIWRNTRGIEEMPKTPGEEYVTEIPEQNAKYNEGVKVSKGDQHPFRGHEVFEDGTTSAWIETMDGRTFGVDRYNITRGGGKDLQEGSGDWVVQRPSDQLVADVDAIKKQLGFFERLSGELGSAIGVTDPIGEAKDRFLGFFQSIWDRATSVVDAVKLTFTDPVKAWENAWVWIGDAVSTMAKMVKNAFSIVKSFFVMAMKAPPVQNAMDDLYKVIQPLLNSLSEKMAKVIETTTDALEPVIGHPERKKEEILKKSEEGVKKVMDSWKSPKFESGMSTTDIAEGLKENVFAHYRYGEDEEGESLAPTVEQIAQALRDNDISDAMDEGATEVGAAVDKVVEGLQPDKVGQKATGLYTSLEATQPIFDKLMEIVNNDVAPILQEMVPVIEAMQPLIEKLSKGVVAFLEYVRIVVSGLGLIAMVADKLASAFISVIEELNSFYDNASDWSDAVKSNVSDWFDDINSHATGGRTEGGTTLVGERGPEVVNLPKGSWVHTAEETRQQDRKRKREEEKALPGYATGGRVAGGQVVVGERGVERVGVAGSSSGVFRDQGSPAEQSAGGSTGGLGGGMALMQAAGSVLYDAAKMAGKGLMWLSGKIWEMTPGTDYLEDLAKGAWDTIVDYAKGVWDSVKSYAQRTARSVWSGVTSAAKSTWGAIQSAAASTWGAIQSAAASTWDLIASAASSMWQSVASMASSTWNTIAGFASSSWDVATSAASSAWDGIVSVAASSWSTIVSIASGAWSAIQAAGEAMMAAIKSMSAAGGGGGVGGGGLMGQLGGAVLGMGTGYAIGSNIGDNTEEGAAIGSGLGYAFGGPIGGALGGTVGGYLDKAIDGGPKDWYQSAEDTVEQWGKEFGDELQSGLDTLGDWGESAVDTVGDWGESVGDTISDVVSDLNPFASGGRTPGNRVLVGERGPEIVDLPAGSWVHTNEESRQMARPGDERRYPGYAEGGQVKSSNAEEKVQKLGEATKDKFNAVDDRLHDQSNDITKTNRRVSSLSRGVSRLEESVAQKLEKVDQRFSSVISSVNGTFDSVNGTFDSVKYAIDSIRGSVESLSSNVKDRLDNQWKYLKPLIDIHRLMYVFASGGRVPGGTTLVGERGPELVDLPRGSWVTPAERTQQIMRDPMPDSILSREPINDAPAVPSGPIDSKGDADEGLLRRLDEQNEKTDKLIRALVAKGQVDSEEAQAIRDELRETRRTLKRPAA